MSAQHNYVSVKECCFTPLVVTLLLLTAAGESASQSIVRKCALNKPFSITVPSNPSTGHTWDASFDSHFLQLKRKRFRRDQSKPERMVGVGGTTTFVFVPIRAGETSVTLRYGRSWESHVVKRRSYRIVISADAR